MTYYNTTNQSGAALTLSVKNAKNQNEAVLMYFQCRSVVQPYISPSEVYYGLLNLGIIGTKVPMTSIRRSITTLTKKGKLVKTQTKVEGAYGREEYCWTVKK